MPRLDIDTIRYFELLDSMTDRNKREVCHFIAFLKYYEDNYENDELEGESV